MLIGSEITCVCFLGILYKVHIGGKGAPTEICPAEGGFPRTSDIKYNFVLYWKRWFFRNLVEAQVAEDHFSFEQVKRCSPKHYSLYSF